MMKIKNRVNLSKLPLETLLVIEGDNELRSVDWLLRCIRAGRRYGRKEIFTVSDRQIQVLLETAMNDINEGRDPQGEYGLPADGIKETKRVKLDIKQDDIRLLMVCTKCNWVIGTTKIPCNVCKRERHIEIKPVVFKPTELKVQ